MTHILDLHKNGKYDALVKQVMEFKLSIQIFDVFGEAIKNYYVNDLFATTETDLDRQLRHEATTCLRSKEKTQNRRSGSEGICLPMAIGIERMSVLFPGNQT